jgi:hypothetical protein
MQGADIQASSVSVSNMMDMMNAFDIVGTGSTALLENIAITQNDLRGTQSRWIGFNANTGAMISIMNATVTSNTNIRHVFSADTNSMMMIDQSTVMSNTGGTVLVSVGPSCI